MALCPCGSKDTVVRRGLCRRCRRHLVAPTADIVANGRGFVVAARRELIDFKNAFIATGQGIHVPQRPHPSGDCLL